MKYTREILEPIVKESESVSQVCRKLGLKLAGGTQSHVKRRILKFEIDVSHFKGKAANYGENHVGGCEKKPWQEILVRDRKDRREDAFRLRRALIESGVEYECSECKIKDYNAKPIVLQVDHIDGDWTNNLKKNLRFLCPNCHSQTQNYGAKNKDGRVRELA